jgi:hypothetical protein
VNAGVLGFGALVVGIAIGIGATLATTRSTEVTTSARATAPAKTAAQPAPVREMVCVRGRSSDARDGDHGCEAQKLATAVCESRLSECTGAREAVRKPWPTQGAASEEPEAFTERIDAALEACDMADLVEAIECSEYPCVVALRDAGANVEATTQRLQDRARSCAPLRAAFGIGAEHDEALGVHPVKVACGDHEETAFVLRALDTGGSAWTAWQSSDQEDNVTDVLRWMFRRGDDVAGVWPCE